MAAAGSSPGGIYTSSDFGFTWTLSSAPNGANEDCASVAISADGTKLVGAYYGSVSISIDAGATWASSAVPATSVASSADGAKLVMVGNLSNYGLIYTRQTTPTPSLSIAPASTNAVLSWIIPSLPFALQQNLDLTTTNWTDVATPPVLNLANLQNQVLVSPPASGNLFYRLMH